MNNTTLSVCSLGTGTMGSTSTAAIASAGFQITLWGRSGASLERGMESATTAVRQLESSGLLRESARDVLDRVRPTTDLEEAVCSADFILESVSENVETKHAVLLEAEKYCRKDGIIGSNTSGLLPSAIASPLRNPERFVVTHFWNPAHLIPLVEVCPGGKTLPETVEAARRFLLSAGKRPAVLRKEANGFIANRLQFALRREALHIVESGVASMEEVDEAVKSSIGRRLADTGPFETADLGGLDVFSSIASYLFADLSADTKPPRLLTEKVREGLLGAKTGQGLYNWEPERKKEVLEARTRTLVHFLRQDRAEIK